MVYMRMTLTTLTLAWSTAAFAQRAEPPVVLGTLAGATAPQRPDGVQVYGTDLGWSYVHQGQLGMLFGDTWRDQRTVCSYPAVGLPRNDDVQATLPMQFSGRVPPLQFVTQPGSPSTPQAVQLLRQGMSLDQGLDRTALTAFSDGLRPIAAFHSATFLHCRDEGEGRPQRCERPFECKTNIGTCQPAPFGVPQLCDVDKQTGCVEGQLCMPELLGYCVDPTSSQPEASRQVPLEVEFSSPRSDIPTQWESRATFVTNKFYNMTARTITYFGDRGIGADFRPGTGAVLIWGRPGFAAGPGYNTALYLMALDLPFYQSNGRFSFKPFFYAGLDAAHIPRWSEDQEDAAPLALDGLPAGDPTERVNPVNQMAISWLDEPIRKWVMIYGGGAITMPGVKASQNSAVEPGALALRFADQPWGPWSEPRSYWSPGDPAETATPLGPGGVLYHPACMSLPSLPCMASDPVRPAHTLNKDCAPPEIETDAGYFYAPNIIDPYTQANDRGGLDVYWNVSTWNPYRVLLMRSSFGPP